MTIIAHVSCTSSGSCISSTGILNRSLGIGQCVGAHNHKVSRSQLVSCSFRTTHKCFPQFFVIFLEWAILFCLWTFATLLAEVARDGSRNDSVDPQEIVIIALYASAFSAHAEVRLTNNCE